MWCRDDPGCQLGCDELIDLLVAHSVGLVVSVATPDEVLDRLGVPGDDVVDDARRARFGQPGRFCDASDDVCVWHL